jgi:hypothetical protein
MWAGSPKVLAWYEKYTAFPQEILPLGLAMIRLHATA